MSYWAIPENIQPPWTSLNWVPEYYRISKNYSSSFCRIPNLADSRFWEIPEFCKTLNGFYVIPVKIHKNLGKSMDFQSCSQSIFYRISNVVSGVCVDIFWNVPFSPTRLAAQFLFHGHLGGRGERVVLDISLVIKTPISKHTRFSRVTVYPHCPLIKNFHVMVSSCFSDYVNKTPGIVRLLP